MTKVSPNVEGEESPNPPAKILSKEFLPLLALFRLLSFPISVKLDPNVSDLSLFIHIYGKVEFVESRRGLDYDLI